MTTEEEARWLAAAAALVEQEAGGLDVLVNNAGITGGMDQQPTTADLDVIRAVVETRARACSATEASASGGSVYAACGP